MFSNRKALGLDAATSNQYNSTRIVTLDKSYFLLGLSQKGLLHLEHAIGLGLFSLGNQTLPHWLHLQASTCILTILFTNSNTSIYFLLFTYIHTKGINNSNTNGNICN